MGVIKLPQPQSPNFCGYEKKNKQSHKISLKFIYFSSKLKHLHELILVMTMFMVKGIPNEVAIILKN